MFGLTASGASLVLSCPSGETGEDWGQNSQTLTAGDLPDSRDRRAAEVVRRHPGKDYPTVVTAAVRSDLKIG
jgi:hypothetical protein